MHTPEPEGAISSTVFPATPRDVPILTATEFAFYLDWDNVPSLAEVCGKFGNDANRAFVWWLRYRALQAWYARDGIRQWLSAGARTPGDVCEVAAGFGLNEHWEFDADAFCQAIDVAARNRAPR